MRAANFKALVLLLALALSPSVSHAAANPDYLLSFWQSEDGLPQNYVTSLAQTPDGYLWIGTYGGLARFDGVRFVCFDALNTAGLKHSRIQRLHVDRQGTLWILTYDGTLTALRRGHFTPMHNIGRDVVTTRVLWADTNQVMFELSSSRLLRG